ncbi:MAG: hypothetical protein IE881_09240 [Epsilonproteobacteria bacterium]|nr:hypothetical protein [Campylobacterota bacterium]
MSPFSKSYKLKQHTPMIHFQSDQKGATLRATEFKPKFDLFLIKHIATLKREPHSSREYLDYKVCIIYDGKNIKDFPKTYVNKKKGDQGYTAPYFANGTSIDQAGDIKITFTSFNRDILEAIDKYLPLFLSYENFGARQSKGFGSYHLTGLTQKEFESFLVKNSNPVYKLTATANTPKEAMGKIDTFYKELKTGTNRPYVKSLLFQYMCSKDLGWEKRWLKEKYPEIIHGKNTPIDCSPRKEYFYIRAMLGLAETNEFRPPEGKKTIRIKSTDKEGDKPKIQRFKSPITFKVFENHVYLLHNDSYLELLDKEFEFTLNGKTNKIRTPKSFDLKEFLSYVEKDHKKITLLGVGK